MDKTQDNKTQLIIAILLGVAGLLILLIFLVVRSQADDAETSASLNNSAPTINLLQIGTTSDGNEVFTEASASITTTGGVFTGLNEYATTPFYVNGTFTDLNGCEDVTAATTPVYMKMATDDIFMGVSQTYSTSSYIVQSPTCTITNCDNETDIVANFECQVDMQYFTDITTTDTPKGVGDARYWRVSLMVTDQGADYDISQVTAEVDTLVAVNVSSSINYGSVAIGARSATQTLQITNTGNDNTTDLEIGGSDMYCTTGTIDKAQQSYSATNLGTYAALTATSSSGTLDFDLGKAVTVSSDSYDNTHWSLLVPTPGGGGALAGTCTGTTTILATSY
ncbi:MAG: hypothetical protein ABII02_04060 [Candidatus Magasanikbacteria bacterium]